MSKSVYLIGAGQIGSRHLQGLKKVKFPLDITVIDPSRESLRVAAERFALIPSRIQHRVSYSQTLPKRYIEKIDLAIIATNSNHRLAALRNLLKTAPVRCLVLEKLLFSKKSEYETAARFLRKNRVRTFINTGMRMVEHYRGLKNELKDQPFYYIVTGSNYGLVTNAIHFIDHMAYLTGCTDFSLDTSNLLTKPIESKRKGFLEFNGTLLVKFKNGIQGTITSFPSGSLPIIVEIHSPSMRFLLPESSEQAWTASEKNGWEWHTIPCPFPWQSNLTVPLATDLLTKKTCNLPRYEESMKLHLLYLEPLRRFLNEHSQKHYDNYPFT
ncbi:oxidoreductase [bacterium]|nr:MAG: oxidoreductase [bacterium]